MRIMPKRSAFVVGIRRTTSGNHFGKGIENLQGSISFVCSFLTSGFLSSEGMDKVLEEYGSISTDNVESRRLRTLSNFSGSLNLSCSDHIHAVKLSLKHFHSLQSSCCNIVTHFVIYSCLNRGFCRARMPPYRTFFVPRIRDAPG